MNGKNYYVYILLNPKNLSPYYIGKGSGSRMYDHFKESDSRNEDKYEMIRGIKKKGYDPKKYTVKLKEDLCESKALELEQFIISKVGIKNLTNKRVGGAIENRDEPEPIECKICGDEIGSKGFPIHLRTHNKDYHEYIKEHIEDFDHLGWTVCINCGDLTKSYGDQIPTCSHECSSEYRKEYYSGEGNPRYGVDMSEETKRKIGEKAKERLSDPENHWNYGNQWSEDVKKKISESHKKRFKVKDIIERLNSIQISGIEDKIGSVLKEYNIDFYLRFSIKTKYGLFIYDFYLPEYKTILEMDGDYWHGGPGCDEYHDDVELTRANDRLKEKVAENQGYELVRVWESEFENDKNIILQKLD